MANIVFKVEIILNICCCFLQAGAVEKNQNKYLKFKNIQNRSAAEDINLCTTHPNNFQYPIINYLKLHHMSIITCWSFRKILTHLWSIFFNVFVLRPGLLGSSLISTAVDFTGWISDWGTQTEIARNWRN